MITEASITEIVATPQLHTEMPYAPGTCAQYSFKAPDFPKPVRVAGVNFYRRAEVRAWVKAYEARKATNKKRR
jgi:hypothetical protein